MKTSVASLALALLAEIAVARDCKIGFQYCGKTLNAIGNDLEYSSRMSRIS
jgi:hypothetical protein